MSKGSQYQATHTQTWLTQRLHLFPSTRRAGRVGKEENEQSYQSDQSFSASSAADRDPPTPTGVCQ